ncbi:MAG TPA: SDR family NAD(P)-dependent oxidoreductase [Ktedonobacterales bacterium]|nr:SDR family NAD(P)-dependent oxidoreductase [Ktedonobacterales bacterium]
MHVTGRTVLITGGSAGIGLALARALLARGNTVVVTGRKRARLDAIRGDIPGLHALVGDVTREADMRDVLTRIRADHGGLDILVNNAAVLNSYDFLGEEDHFAQLDEEVATNLLGTIKVTRLALPFLLERPDAAVVTMSSAVAYVPIPSLPIYSATKAAVHSLSQSLRHQFAGTSVKVIEVLPPWVDTELASGVPGAKVSTDVVAQAIIGGLKHETEEIRVGQVKALSVAARLSPALGARLMARASAARRG